MAGGTDVAAAVTAEASVARRLWRVVRAVLYMLRRGLGVPSGRKLAMDLHLLLHRGKIAGKSLGDLVTFHHQHHHHGAFSAGAAAAGSSFSCRVLDPALAVHEPSRGRREVVFSCSNTPSSGYGGLLSAAKLRRRNRDEAATSYYNYDAADIARVFEMLNDSEHLFNDDADAPAAATATPSPTLVWTPLAFGRSPAARQLRITDSPFAARDDDGIAAGEQQVDRQADEFIRRFYEQLRAQQSVAATPDYYAYGANSYSGRAPRPAAAGIA